jgi:chromosome segregation ATPase
MIRNSTDNELQSLEDSINLQLNNTEEKHVSGKKKLEELLEQVSKEFIDKKNENEAEEMKLIANNMNAEINQFKASVSEYDSMMRSHKQTMMEMNKSDDTAKALLIETKIKRDKLREQYENYKDAHSRYTQKMNQLKYEEDVKMACAEYIQATVRGYQTRKAQLKKYKFLKVLRAPKIIEIDPNAKPGKGKGK